MVWVFSPKVMGLNLISPFTHQITLEKSLLTLWPELCTSRTGLMASCMIDNRRDAHRAVPNLQCRLNKCWLLSSLSRCLFSLNFCPKRGKTNESGWPVFLAEVPERTYCPDLSGCTKLPWKLRATRDLGISFLLRRMWGSLWKGGWIILSVASGACWLQDLIHQVEMTWFLKQLRDLPNFCFTLGHVNSA